MFQNVLLFINLKMFKIGCMLNIIYCNKPCVACCSVWHRTTTVHLVILMWITSSKISWVLQLTAWLAIAAQWSGLIVLCNVQRIVTNHTESQFFQERRAAMPSPFTVTGGWLHMCSFKKCITHSHPVNLIFCPLFLHTFWHMSCANTLKEKKLNLTTKLLMFFILSTTFFNILSAGMVILTYKEKTCIY